MKRALPIWCCLNKKSKLALLDMLAVMGETEFNEPQPIWRVWHPGIKAELQVITDDVDYDKFMRQAPSRSRW